MNATLLCQIWSLILDIKHFNLDKLDRHKLIECLIAELKQREIITLEEIAQATTYISNNVPLIHDLVNLSSLSLKSDIN